jgi:hypothetical protein
VEQNAFLQYLAKKNDIAGIDFNAIDTPPKVIFDRFQCCHEVTIKIWIFEESRFGDDAYVDIAVRPQLPSRCRTKQNDQLKIESSGKGFQQPLQHIHHFSRLDFHNMTPPTGAL